MRTKKEIKEAVQALMKNRMECAPTNFFGENNLIRVDIMLDVIKENRNEEFIYINYPSCFENGKEDTIGHGNWNSAMNALHFLQGDMELTDLLYPVNS